MFSSVQAALSTSTAKTIQGSSPYLELNGVKATDLNSLLSIKVGGVSYQSDAAGNMVDGSNTPVVGAITLANVGDTFASVSTLVDADNSSYALSSTAVVPLSARKDDDGDGVNLFTVTGNLRGIWKDKNGNVVTNLSGSLSICLSPYTLTLSTTGSPSISTQYGVPRTTSYGNAAAVYTINPAGSAICYAKPDMTYATGNYAGPASMWDTTKGFKIQSESSYGDNFPTTGANDLHFDLIVVGIDATMLTWSGGAAGKITVTPSVTDSNTVEVTLYGPTSQDSSGGFNPVADNAIAEVPTLPATFVIEGKDSSNNIKVSYGFVLTKWYLNRQYIYSPAMSGSTVNPDGLSYINMNDWCNGLNGTSYRLPKVEDLTSAQGVIQGGLTIPIVPYPNSNSNSNMYWRHIGAGLFSEWGYMNAVNGYFVHSAYWTSDIAGSGNFVVSGEIGSVQGLLPPNALHGICVTP